MGIKTHRSYCVGFTGGLSVFLCHCVRKQWVWLLGLCVLAKRKQQSWKTCSRFSLMMSCFKAIVWIPEGCICWPGCHFSKHIQYSTVCTKMDTVFLKALRFFTFSMYSKNLLEGLNLFHFNVVADWFNALLYFKENTWTVCHLFYLLP